MIQFEIYSRSRFLYLQHLHDLGRRWMFAVNSTHFACVYQIDAICILDNSFTHIDRVGWDLLDMDDVGHFAWKHLSIYRICTICFIFSSLTLTLVIRVGPIQTSFYSHVCLYRISTIKTTRTRVFAGSGGIYMAQAFHILFLPGGICVPPCSI